MASSFPLEVLQSKSLPELRAIGEQLGLPNKRSKAEMILLIAQASYTNDVVQEAAPKPVFEEFYTTPDELLIAMEPFTRKKMQVTINEQDKTWNFKYYINEDSGTLKQPLAVILRKAETLTKARLPAFIKDGELAGAMAL